MHALRLIDEHGEVAWAEFGRSLIESRSIRTLELVLQVDEPQQNGQSPVYTLNCIELHRAVSAPRAYAYTNPG